MTAKKCTEKCVAHAKFYFYETCCFLTVLVAVAIIKLYSGLNEIICVPQDPFLRALYSDIAVCVLVSFHGKQCLDITLGQVETAQNLNLY